MLYNITYLMCLILVTQIDAETLCLLFTLKLKVAVNGLITLNCVAAVDYDWASSFLLENNIKHFLRYVVLFLYT